jgi:putative Holliday junction resolvase
MPEGPPVRTLLGFDHGEKRIGVAVGQCLTHTASSITTLKAANGQPDWNMVTRLIEEWRPDALVVGHPLRSDGSKSASTEAAERFARRLEGRYHLPVHLMDERLSSATAEDLLASRGKTGDKAAVDALAARIILQHWLDSHRDTA